MGYALHITTSSGRDTAPGDRISEEQWRAIVANDAELGEFDTSASAINPRTGEIIRGPAMLATLWTDPENGEQYYFHFRAGEISVSSPSEGAIGKMKRIAVALGARVEGDEGELY